jgi:hypothetical protein
MRDKMKTLSSVFSSAVMTLIFLMPTILPADDQESNRLMHQELTRLMAQIHQDTGMSGEEVERLQWQLHQALRLAGESGPVQTTARTSHSDGCQGDCLREAIHLMVRAMERGYSSDEAGKMVCQEVRTCVRGRAQSGLSDEEMGLRLRNRVEARISLRNSNGDGSGGMSGSSSRGGAVFPDAGSKRESGSSGSDGSGSGNSGSGSRR